MQNSLTFGEIAKQPYRVQVPQKEPKEILPPDIRSRTTQTFTDRDMDFCQTVQAIDYHPFKEIPMRKKDKRSTCTKKGSQLYQTDHSS